MASVFTVLCFVVLVVCPSPCIAITDCSQYDLSVTNTTDLQPVLATVDENSDYHYQQSYFQPLEGFRGFSVNIQWLRKTSKDTDIYSYFKAHERCFDNGDQQRWSEVVVGCQYKTFGHIACAVIAGDCLWMCEKNHTALLDKPWARLRWAAHGPSRWRRTPPHEDCPWQGRSGSVSHLEDMTCRDSLPAPPPFPSPSPSFTTTTTTMDSTQSLSSPTTTTTTTPLNVVVVVVVPVIVVLVIVLVIVLVVRKKRRQRTTPTWSAVPTL